MDPVATLTLDSSTERGWHAWHVAVLAALALAAMIASGTYEFRAHGRYGQRPHADLGAKREFDPAGNVRWIGYDSNGDHRTDSWAEYDNGRVIRLIVDDDGDGVIDRAYTYDPDGIAHEVPPGPGDVPR